MVFGDEQLTIRFTKDFYDVLDKVDDKISLAIMQLEENDKIHNRLEIELIDISSKDSCFTITSRGRDSHIKITQFLKYYIPEYVNMREINALTDFIKGYNKYKCKTNYTPNGATPIVLPEFSYNPMDVRSTFLSLVTETYPYGTEEEVMKYMPKDLNKDRFGNYFKVIGDNPTTMFTSHLDTASKDKSKVYLMSYTKSNQEFIVTDGMTILGADDKAGVTVMLYLMANNVPGLYYFFLGEERGGIGSGKLETIWTKSEYNKQIKRCVSFDRRDYYSVISEQMGVTCCSDKFALSLCKELNKDGLKMKVDPTGIFTDSANFIDHIPECTNISVGYFNEHTVDEVQNITFLERLAKACVKVDWTNLTTDRMVGIDDKYYTKYPELFEQLESNGFYNELKLKSLNGMPEINLSFDNVEFDAAMIDLENIQDLLLKYNIDPVMEFDSNTIKIQIN